MKKKCQVVMLPTEKASKIFYDKDQNKLQLGLKETLNTPKENDCINQHLYITSNEEIKEGNWCINKNQDTLYQITNKDGEYPNRTDIRNHWNKIIATTDKSILIEESINLKVPYSTGFAKIHESFIKAFVESNGTIKEVLVEYGYTIDKSMGHFYQERNYFLKTNPNNSIIISLINRTYTKEDMLDLLHAIDTGINPMDYESSRGLDTIDFFDLAVCKASQYNLLKEFKELREKLKAKI